MRTNYAKNLEWKLRPVQEKQQMVQDMPGSRVHLEESLDLLDRLGFILCQYNCVSCLSSFPEVHLKDITPSEDLFSFVLQRSEHAGENIAKLICNIPF